MTHDHRSPGLPLDPRLLELLRCPACHAELEPPRARGAGLPRVHPGLPGPRRGAHPAGRRGPDPGLTARSARGDARGGVVRRVPARRRGQPGPRRRDPEVAGRGRQPGPARGGLGSGRRGDGGRGQPRRPAARRHRGRPRLATAARGPGAGVPGAVRGVAEPGPARLDRPAGHRGHARARRRRPRQRQRRGRGRPSWLPGRGGLPGRVPGGPARRRPAHDGDPDGRRATSWPPRW